MARTKTVSDEALLRVARAAFVERGFAASTKEIARRAGVSEGVLFQRYPTKADLFFAAMALPAADLKDLLRTRRLAGWRDLAAAATAMLAYFRSSMPVLLAIASSPDFRFEEFARRHPDSPLDTLRRELVVFFAAEREAGRIGAAADPAAAALMIFALAQSVAFFEEMGAHGGRMPDQVVRGAIRAMWDGLAPITPARKPRGRRRQ